MRSGKPDIRSIAIVTPFYPPHVGGVERYSQEFARATLALGISVNVVTTDSCPQPIETIEDGIRVMRLPAQNLPLMGSHYPIATRGWQRATKLLQCDVVLSQTRFFMTTLVAAVHLARRHRKICVLDHGSGPLRTSPRILAFGSLLYERAATALLKRLSARFFAVSKASADWLGEFGINGAPIIPNGVKPRHQMPRRTSAAFDDPIVFFAGRLLPEKGVKELVGAVDILTSGGTRIRLRIAGEGPLSNFLVKRAASRPHLTYLGRLAPDQVANELDRASVFVNPSNYPEGLPTILLEAGSSALPVISTPRGGSADIIRDGVTGWLIPVGSQEHIASRLNQVLASPEEALRRGAELFRLVQRDFTWPAIARSFLDFVGERAA